MSVKQIAWQMTIITLTISLTIAGCKRSAPGGPQGQMPAPEVSVFTVQTEPIVTTVELPGRTSAYRVAEVRPQVNGIIQDRLFEEGGDVQAGCVLYQIDPATYQAACDSAKALQAKAQATLTPLKNRAERYKELVAIKAVSQQDYDDAAAALKLAEAEVQYTAAAVENARINLAYTRVTAPISGRIGKSNVTHGALVTAFQPTSLTTIQQLDPIYVDVPQSTVERLRLQRRLDDGQVSSNGTNVKAVRLKLEDGTEYPIEGTLQFRDVTVDPTTGSVILRMVFPNPNGVLLPGMFVRTVIKEGTNDKAVLVPQQAISRDPKGNPWTLVVNAANKVEQRRLTLERPMGDRWLVAAGLSADDRLIMEGALRARPGTEVKAVPWQDGKTAAGAAPSAPASK